MGSISMVLRIASMTALLPAFFLGACSPESSTPTPSAATGEQPPAPSTRVSDDDHPVLNAEKEGSEADELEIATEPSAAVTSPDPIPLEVTDRRRRGRTEALFGEVMNSLSEAAEAHDEHGQLDESTWFGRDQDDNRKRIDDLLDEAIAVLRVSEIETTRAELRRLEGEIDQLEAQRIMDREASVSAPLEQELNQLQRTYTTSREDLDQRIQEAARGIAERRDQTRDLQLEFVRQMNAIGVKLDLTAAQSLLSTVTGDDFVEMCVVFDNVRGVTIQLQELTEKSGESLEAAQRYYGSFVVLIRLMDKVQQDFVRRVTEEMIPRLEELAAEAGRIIQGAEENMARGGDRSIGEQNIRSNQLTIQATGLYVDYLRGQAAEIRARNTGLQISLRDAENTYATVTLSSEVATLLREGQRNFAALLKLDLPSLRGFENAELKAEFEHLTAKMTHLD